jgi:hypothetical protein
MLGFSIVCHECGHCLYEGMDMIVLYRLRRKIDNKCPGCGRTLSLYPLSIKIEDQETNKAWLIEKS